MHIEMENKNSSRRRNTSCEKKIQDSEEEAKKKIEQIGMSYVRRYELKLSTAMQQIWLHSTEQSKLIFCIWSMHEQKLSTVFFDMILSEHLELDSIRIGSRELYHALIEMISTQTYKIGTVNALIKYAPEILKAAAEYTNKLSYDRFCALFLLLCYGDLSGHKAIGYFLEWIRQFGGKSAIGIDFLFSDKDRETWIREFVSRYVEGKNWEKEALEVYAELMKVIEIDFRADTMPFNKIPSLMKNLEEMRDSVESARKITGPRIGIERIIEYLGGIKSPRMPLNFLKCLLELIHIHTRIRFDANTKEARMNRYVDFLTSLSFTVSPVYYSREVTSAEILSQAICDRGAIVKQKDPVIVSDEQFIVELIKVLSNKTSQTDRIIQFLAYECKIKETLLNRYDPLNFQVFSLVKREDRVLLFSQYLFGLNENDLVSIPVFGVFVRIVHHEFGEEDHEKISSFIAHFIYIVWEQHKKKTSIDLMLVKNVKPVFETAMRKANLDPTEKEALFFDDLLSGSVASRAMSIFRKKN